MVMSCPRVLLLAVIAGLSSCSTLSSVFDRQDESSLGQVDSLLGAVEQVHLECELSRQQSLKTLDALHSVVSPTFQGDAIAAHQGLLEALENSKLQAATLRQAMEPMSNAAVSVASKWSDDLAAYSSDRMRERSRERLDATNQLYSDVQVSLVSALDLFDMYNNGLNDHALYLGNDLNATSVSAIEEELLMVTKAAELLDNRLALCMEACQVYVRENALRGQLTMQVAPEPVPVAGLRPGLSAGN